MDDPKVIDAIVILYVLLRTIVLLIIVIFLMLKALSFRRAGKFGDALAKSNIAVAIAYAGTLLLLVGLDFFRTTPWIIGITLAVAFHVVRAGMEMKNLYGSWKQVFKEAEYALQDFWTHILSQPLGMKIAMALYFLEFLAAIVLVEVKGTPKEWILPTMLIQLEKQETPTPAPLPPIPLPPVQPSPTALADSDELRSKQAFVPVRVSEAEIFAWAAINPCSEPLGSDWVCYVQHRPLAFPPYQY